ncbi:MAG TPA: polymer-forming cytoskeletal protein [Rhodocyclaceae bacterium]|nr:polymer-forming cytoskeletal protein [Rhodocyclaceae bacterium]
MFGKQNQQKAHGQVSLIGPGTRIEGNVRFSGGLRIEGEVLGNVEAAEGAAGTLFLSEQARVEGRVNVSHFVSSGTVLGPVSVSESLELQPTARIEGDVDYAAIEMHQGAVIEGRLTYRSKSSVELKLAASN